MKTPIKKKSFEKDDTAQALVKMMVQEPDFNEIPDAIKASELGVSVEELTQYLSDPVFLRWSVKTMQDLYVQKLPEVMHRIYEQALEGNGRQQKMLLDFMKVSNEEKEEKSPNIVIVNNIPNPDQQEPEIVADV